MLPCIACSRHVVDDDDDVDDEDRAGSTSGSIAGAAETKTLTSQLKYVVLKISSSYRQCRPCSGFRAGNHTLGSEELFVGTSDASSSDGWTNNKSGKQQRAVVAGSDSEGTKGKVPSSPRSSGQLSCSTRNSNATTKTEAADEEWVAQVEPGVLITFVALPNGENELKRIRFSREMFNKWQAESWWSENCERVHELYNVAGSDHSFPNTRREAPAAAANGVTRLAEQQQHKDMNSSGEEAKAPKQDSTKSLQTDELTEWVEEDEPGVYITVKIGPNGRELKRVRFSREKFSERQAKLWWEKNRFRIHDQYL